MKKQTLKSFSDLSILKKNLDESNQKSLTANHEIASKRDDAQPKSKLASDGTDAWEPIHKILSNKLFEEVASGEVNTISSKNYSIVLSALTYPKTADASILQEQLDQAHDIALRIKRGLKAGRIKYTNAKIPSPWAIGGNPGTKR